MGFWSRAAHLLRRTRFNRELEDEIQSHLDARVEELEETGISPLDARSQARREFGSRPRMQEDARAPWQFQWLEDALADLRFAARSFSRTPAFALTAIACLALGIGANTLIFSLVDAVLLRSLPYPNAERLVMVRFTPPNQRSQKLGTNAGSYFFIREHNTVFERMGALRLTASVLAPEGGAAAPQQLQSGWSTPGLTDVMGVSPLLGRWFAREDKDFNIVISYGFWQRAYGGATNVLGKKLVWGRYGAATVIGVAPPEFQTLDPNIDVWLLQDDDNLARARRSPNRVFNLFARLKPGVTIAQAQAEMDSLAGPLGQEMDMNRGWGIKVDSLREAYFGRLRRPLIIFQGAVLCLLLIACANVAGLQLARASARHKELAMRAALGSSRNRVIRQLLTESMLLALLGGLFGLGLAWMGLRVLESALPTLLPHSVSAGLDLTVLAFSLLLAMGTGLIFGGLPALQISRPDLMDVLRESSRGSTAAGGNLRGAFVVVQVALALVLLIGAGLLTNSLLRLNLVRPGLDPHRLITFQVPFPNTFYSGSGNTPAGGFQVELSPRLNQLSEAMRERVSILPGVDSAALAMTPPLGGTPRRFNFSRENRPLTPSEQESWSAEWYPVGAAYFYTLRIPLLRGREFNAFDSDTARPVAVVNTTLAQRFFPNEDPMGKTIQIDMLYDQPREIVGVVGDVRQNRYEYAPEPQMYVPRAQLPRKMDMTLTFDVVVATFIVRAKGDPAALAPSIRGALADVDRSQAVTNVSTVEQYAAGQLEDLRRYAALLGAFGGVSVALSIVGLFGIMAHAVSQRTNEIGIRVALGAGAGSVLGLVAQQALVLVGAGMFLGVAASLMLTRIVASFLWGVSATDPLTFALSLAAMSAVSVLACYVPARRALKIDPIMALKWE